MSFDVFMKWVLKKRVYCRRDPPLLEIKMNNFYATLTFIFNFKKLNTNYQSSLTTSPNEEQIQLSESTSKNGPITFVELRPSNMPRVIYFYRRQNRIDPVFTIYIKPCFEKLLPMISTSTEPLKCVSRCSQLLQHQKIIKFNNFRVDILIFL